MDIVNWILHTFEDLKTFALVGRSGTGKSYRANALAEKKRIDLIIDDGLLIKDGKIIAGHSAKQDESFLAAIKTAIFDDYNDRNEIIRTISQEYYPRILVIGTSEKMIERICNRLNLPFPEKIFHIEDLSTPEEIEMAMKFRYQEGTHIIPIALSEATKKYSNIVFDSISSGIFSGHEKIGEKTIVTPVFSQRKEEDIKPEMVRYMVVQSLLVRLGNVMLDDFVAKKLSDGWDLYIKVRVPENPSEIVYPQDICDYLVDSLEKYGNVRISNMRVEVEMW